MKTICYLRVLFLWTINFLIINPALMAQEEAAQKCLYNAKIYTLNESEQVVDAVAIMNDKILATGSYVDIVKRYCNSSTEMIDLGGGIAYPGFIEGHGHFFNLGDSKLKLDLSNVENWNEVQEIIKNKVKLTDKGDWIEGNGWHQEKWNHKPEHAVYGYPMHTSLSAMSMDNPVVLVHASLHACFANARAMEIAGILDDTPDPPGGKIMRDKQGKAIGIFEENAADLIYRAMEKDKAAKGEAARKDYWSRVINIAQQECLKNGITGFHDAGVEFKDIDYYKEKAEEGSLKVRLYTMLWANLDELKNNKEAFPYTDFNGFLMIKSIKKMLDGALGSHGAWFTESYHDHKNNHGQNIISVEELSAIAEFAADNDMQLCVHCIGDKANHEVLNMYEKIYSYYSDKPDMRWRIEHAQHLLESDIPRFGNLGVIPSMQTCHCTSDALFVEKRLGHKRASKGAYAWRSLMDSGAMIVNGTDTPIESIDPIANFYSAVTRKGKNGDTFFPDQKMSRIEALKAITVNAAYASFQERLKGTIEPGKWADITVLSKDILTIPDDQILKTNVTHTIVGGQLMYKNERE